MKKRKTFSFWGFFGKLFMIACFPFYLALLLIATVIGIIVDSICSTIDKKTLSRNQAVARKTDRIANRTDFFLNHIVDYFKNNRT